MGGYREAQLRAQCADCEQMATGHCERCGRPHCRHHVLPPDTLCQDCEDEWSLVHDAESASIPTKVLWCACGVAGAVLALVAGPAAPSVALFAGGLAGAAAPYAAWKLTRRGRRTFIAEGARHERLRALWGREPRTARQLPPAPDDSRE